MIEGLDAGRFCPASFCKTLSHFWDLGFPICAMKGPFDFDNVWQCQEDFPFSCCFGQSVLACLVRLEAE